MAKRDATDQTRRMWPDETPEEILGRCDPEQRKVVEAFLKAEPTRRPRVPETVGTPTKGASLPPVPYPKKNIYKSADARRDTVREVDDWQQRRAQARKLARKKAQADGRKARAEAHRRATGGKP